MSGSVAVAIAVVVVVAVVVAVAIAVAVAVVVARGVVLYSAFCILSILFTHGSTVQYLSRRQWAGK